MIPRILLGKAAIPGTRKELELYQSGDLFSIKIAGRGDLMNSRVHGSEKALAQLACARLARKKNARVLIGGLGMGFTLAAALDELGADAEVVVAELVPEVVEWNRSLVGEPAGHPLADPRSTVYVGDVSDVIRRPSDGFDAILLDVDNGPEAMVRVENDWLYQPAGLRAARSALRPRGVLAVWSAGPSRAFAKRLQQSGFDVEEVIVRPHRAGKGPRHYVWIGALGSR
jgi:spermidine synthase